MLPEPIQFTQDHNGSYHFASEAQPLHTVIDIANLAFPFIKPDKSRGTVEITLDGRRVIYDRTGIDPHGRWICVLRIGKQDHAAST